MLRLVENWAVKMVVSVVGGGFAAIDLGEAVAGQASSARPSPLHLEVVDTPQLRHSFVLDQEAVAVLRQYSTLSATLGLVRPASPASQVPLVGQRANPASALLVPSFVFLVVPAPTAQHAWAHMVTTSPHLEA